MAAPDVIGIGHVTCDIICPLEAWPELDTKTVIPGIMLAGGGPAANAIAALACLGISTGLVGRLGDDLLGRYAHREHEVAGIDISHLELSPDAVSPVSIILSDLEAGTRTILLTKGRDTALVPERLDWDWLQQARVIHLDGHQMAASLAVATRARDWPDTSIMLDAGSMREGMVELCGLCDIVIASQHFARELSNTDEPRDCITQLRNLGARIAGVTLGARGSLCTDGTGIVKQQAFTVESLDTTGAGDAYHGGFIYGCLEGWPLAQCMQFASAVAALKCTGIGAREGLPNTRQVQELILRGIAHG
jgi:ribokinase